jgi:hypothetical protein
MFGIPIDGPAHVFCDNQGSKKHNAVYYHAVHEAVAAGTMKVTKEDGNTSTADLLTKPLTEQRQISLLRSILYNL